MLTLNQYKKIEVSKIRYKKDAYRRVSELVSMLDTKSLNVTTCRRIESSIRRLKKKFYNKDNQGYSPKHLDIKKREKKNRYAQKYYWQKKYDNATNERDRRKALSKISTVNSRLKQLAYHITGKKQKTVSLRDKKPTEITVKREFYSSIPFWEHKREIVDNVIENTEKYKNITFFGKKFRTTQGSKIEVHYNRFFNFVKNLQRYEDVTSPLVDIEIIGPDVVVYNDPMWDLFISEYDNDDID